MIIYKSYFSRTDVPSNENMKEDLLLLFPILIIGIVTILLFFGLEPIMNFIQIYIIKYGQTKSFIANRGVSWDD